MYARATTWIDRPSEEVLGLATTCSAWQRWCEEVELDPGSPDALVQVGDETVGTLPHLAGAAVVTFRVLRRLRGIVTIGAFRDGQQVATLVFSSSPWDGGCLVELRLESDTPRRTNPSVRHRLRRSLRTLAKLSAIPAGAPPSPRSAARPARRRRPAWRAAPWHGRPRLSPPVER